MLCLMLLIFQSTSILATEFDLKNETVPLVAIPHRGQVHPKYKNTLFVLNSTRIKAITFSSVSIPRKNNDYMYLLLCLLSNYISFKYLLPLGALCGFLEGAIKGYYYDYRLNGIKHSMMQLPLQLSNSTEEPYCIPLENLQYGRPMGKSLYDVMTNNIPWIKSHIKTVPRPMIKIEEASLTTLSQVWPQGSLMGFEKLELTTVSGTNTDLAVPVDSRLLVCIDNYRYIHFNRPQRYSYQSILLRLLILLGFKRENMLNDEGGDFQSLTRVQRNNLHEALNNRFLEITRALFTNNRQIVTKFRMPYNS